MLEKLLLQNTSAPKESNDGSKPKLLWSEYLSDSNTGQMHLISGQLNWNYASLFRHAMPLCTPGCSRFPPALLAVGLVELLLLLPILPISTALRSHSLGFSNKCKNTQSVSLFTLPNTSTPFKMKDPSSTRYRRPASFSRKMAPVSPASPRSGRLINPIDLIQQRIVAYLTDTLEWRINRSQWKPTETLLQV
jgi:hypothetical protein